MMNPNTREPDALARATARPEPHIVWTKYGTWLPGDSRGWVKSKTWGVQPPDPDREELARAAMAGDPVTLSHVQRALVEQTIRDHCTIRQWTLHAVSVRTNHVHIVVTADRDANDIMEQFKAWCSRRLSDAARLVYPLGRKAGRKRWFTEGGDKEYVADEAYLENAIGYVSEGQ